MFSGKKKIVYAFSLLITFLWGVPRFFFKFMIVRPPEHFCNDAISFYKTVAELHVWKPLKLSAHKQYFFKNLPWRNGWTLSLHIKPWKIIICKYCENHLVWSLVRNTHCSLRTFCIAITPGAKLTFILINENNYRKIVQTI